MIKYKTVEHVRDLKYNSLKQALLTKVKKKSYPEEGRKD